MFFQSFILKILNSNLIKSSYARTVSRAIDAQIVIFMPYRCPFQWEMIKGIDIDTRLRSLMPSGTPVNILAATWPAYTTALPICVRPSPRGPTRCTRSRTGSKGTWLKVMIIMIQNRHHSWPHQFYSPSASSPGPWSWAPFTPCHGP